MKYCFLFYLFSFLICFSLQTQADEDDDDSIKTVQLIDGETRVFLNTNHQKIAGIKTLKLKSYHHQNEFLTSASVVNIKPLLELRYQYLNIQTKIKSLSIKIAQTQKDIQRLNSLHKEQVVATRKIQNKRSELQSDKALLEGLHYQSKLIQQQIIVDWGNVISEWIMSSNSPTLSKLIKQEFKLLKVSLPSDFNIEIIDTVAIAPRLQRLQATQATFISASPQINFLTQKPSYFFQSKDKKIKAGMRLYAWIALSEQKQTGVLIPKSSVLWHLGQAIVFIKTDTEQFSHRNLSHFQKTPNGYFVQDDIKANEEIVITGAQMLLSEEYRGQIPDEDDDD